MINRTALEKDEINNFSIIQFCERFNIMQKNVYILSKIKFVITFQYLLQPIRISEDHHVTLSAFRHFGPGGSLDRRVNLSLRVSAQMDWREIEDKGETRLVLLAPGGCARSKGY
jgi:hypothetical protein